MRITKLHLKNIGAFADEVIEFKEKTNPEKAEIHILTGENGTGKSTILYALAGINNPMLVYSIEELLKSPIAKRFRHYDSSSFLKIYYNNKNTFLLSGDNDITLDQSFSGSIYKYFEKQREYKTKKFEFLFFAYSNFRNLKSNDIYSMEDNDFNPFDGILIFDNYQTDILNKWIANVITKEALALAKGDKEKAAKHRRSLNRIEQAVSNITEQKIEFDLEDEPLNVVLKVDNKKLEFDVLPDGLKSIISWIADLLMRMDRIKWATGEDILDRNFILFLDEIEVHLHPAWQRKILPEVQKLFKNSQIFISTHSPFVVGSVEDAWVYKLKLENGNSKVVEVVESKAGESINLILDEVFGIEEEFDEETEKEFREFYQLRDNLLKGNWDLEAELNEKAALLAQKSIEIKDIVGRELRQIHKLKSQKPSLVK